MTTTVNIRLDRATKKELRKYADELGFTTAEFASRLIKQTVQKKDFEVREELVPTPYLQECMRRAEEEYANGELTFMDWDEAIAHLESMMESP